MNNVREYILGGLENRKFTRFEILRFLKIQEIVILVKITSIWNIQRPYVVYYEGLGPLSDGGI